MLKYTLPPGGYVTFTNSAGSWLRIIVLNIADTRVELGFAWEEGYHPRATPQRIRLGDFRVRALEFDWTERIVLGVDVPRGFRASTGGQGQPVTAQADSHPL